MKNILIKSDWARTLKNYVITDCAIRENNIFYLLAENCLDDRDMRQIVLIDDDHERYLIYAITKYSEPFTGFMGASKYPISQGLLVEGLGGAVRPAGGGKETWDMECVNDHDNMAIRKIKQIDGYAWVVGLERFVSRRMDVGKWQPITDGMVFAFDKDNTDVFDYGFEDIDGFSEKDIYAVGGKGDVWHYDGVIWNQCSFPSNENLKNVVCAGDGYVYVASKNHIWQGRLNRWELVSELSIREGLNDLCWFNNELWGCGRHDFFHWDGHKVSNNIIVDNKNIILSGVMDCNGETLIIATPTSVWVSDGSKWLNIVPEYN